MNKYYEEFLEMLENENKEGCVNFALEKLEKGDVGIITLYSEILTPALNNMTCKLQDKNLCIWKEHVRSSIVRTIIECCYPYILKEKRKYNIKGEKGIVVVVCPPEEYHEIGARIVADFFVLKGYQAIFVGSNTPKEEFLSALKIVKPKYIALSITNYFNLISTKAIIEKIKEHSKEVKVIVGGSAFLSNPKAYKAIGADKLLMTYEDIEKLEEEELK